MRRRFGQIQSANVYRARVSLCLVVFSCVWLAGLAEGRKA